MKKTINALLILASVTFLFACGGKSKDDTKNEGTKDSTLVTENKPVVKDYKYFDKLAKELKVEGLELSSANTYSDSASNSFSYGFYIKDAKAKGADKIIIKAGSVARLGNKEDVVTSSLAEFEKVNTAMYKSQQGVSISTFKEWKKDENIFYYYTLKGVSDQMGGQKNYNQLFASYVKDDVYLDVLVSVYDNKSDMVKAESILIQVMEYIVK